MARRIAHVSDLHFGSADERLVDPLLEALQACDPDLVVVSGDLTQRAKRAEFEAARRFLDRLSAPMLVVPGNHDIPLYNVALRFFAPRRRWNVRLGLPWTATWEDDEMVVVGIDSPRRWRAKEGAISRAQVRHVEKEMSRAPHSACRIVVLHHPLALPRRMKIGLPHAIGARHAGKALRDVGTDVVLAGHLHLSRLHQVVDTERDGLLHVIAPSAISTRLRGETNGFNVLDVDVTLLRTTLHSWDSHLGAYVGAESSTHHAGARAKA